jgi:hypothetical protein
VEKTLTVPKYIDGAHISPEQKNSLPQINFLAKENCNVLNLFKQFKALQFYQR